MTPVATTPRLTAPAGSLSVGRLSHSYGGVPAISDITFDVQPGEIVALLGPSGCGKSTILRTIAGLISPTSGQVCIGGRDVTRHPVRARDIGMVFQNYALFPHLTVAENIAYPLACRSVSRRQRRDRVAELAALVRLGGLEARLPRELSGGQQQRVAIARALASKPALLLLDEPFGALDRALRFDLQVELLRLQKSLGVTTLLVTHDQEEAQSLASRLVLMDRGQVAQIGAPAEVYDRPQTLFVNTFIGHANCLAGTVAAAGLSTAVIDLQAGGQLRLPRPINFTPGSAVVVTCRAEEARLGEPLEDGVPARLVVSAPFGPALTHELDLADGTSLRVTERRLEARFRPEPGQPVSIVIDPARCHVFPAPQSSSASPPPRKVP